MKTLFRFYLRFLVMLFLLFSAVLLFIRLQARANPELRQLLLPDGCPAPCFMGIRPGVTTQEEALQLVSTSNWTNIDSTRLDSFKSADTLLFQWNGNQSLLIDGNSFLVLHFQAGEPRTVAQLLFHIRNTLTLGDMYLVLGKPSRYSWSLADPNPNGGSAHLMMTIYLAYDNPLMNLTTFSTCPVNPHQLSRESVGDIEYGPSPRIDFQQPSPYITDMLNAPYCD